MSISQYNYEAYFLDYHEGRLDAEATKELMQFLALHPELKEEFESFEAVTLNDIEEIKFENKESLKKSVSLVNATNFDEMAAQYVDNTLSAPFTEELLKFVRLYPEYEKELAAYKLTKLTPDTSIFFEDKDSLKRRGRRASVYYYWSAAASVAIIVAGYFMLSKPTPQPNSVVAVNNITDTTTVHTIAPANKTLAVSPVEVTPVKTNTVRKHHTSSHTAINNDNVAIVNKQQAAIEEPKKVITPDITPKDSTAYDVNHIALNTPKDTNNAHNNFVQQPVVSPENKFAANNSQKESTSLFAKVSGAVKSVGSIFKRGGVGFHKYYSPEDSGKVIAYQITLGDNRYTLAKK